MSSLSSSSPRLAIVARRTLGDKLQEIAERCPADIIALEKIVDFMLVRIREDEHRKHDGW
jgi:hypothetical protein